MPKTGQTQECSKCGEAKPLPEFRRQSHRPSGRDTICKACRKKAYEDAKAKRFGPLPEPEGSKEWLDEIWRRAAVIKAEKQP